MKTLLRDMVKRANTAVERANTREERANTAEEIARNLKAENLRYTFLENLTRNNFSNRKSMLDAMVLAEFKSIGHPNNSTRSTDEIIKDTQSVHSYHPGKINMSVYKKRYSANTTDAMNVRRLNISRDGLMQPLKQICTEANIDYEDVISSEVEIIKTIRLSLIWLKDNKIGMSEDAVQRIFILYVEGLLENLNRKDFKVITVAGTSLSASILVTNRLGKIVSKELCGKSDVCIAFGETERKISAILEERSVTVEIKYNRFGTQGGIAACTSQQLAQIFAISKMRPQSIVNKYPVRSILTDFMQLRISIGVNTEETGLQYIISSLYDEPEDFVAAISFLLSVSIDESIVASALVDIKDDDLGEENEGGDDFYDGSEDDNDNDNDINEPDHTTDENTQPPRNFNNEISHESKFDSKLLHNKGSSILSFLSDNHDASLERKRKVQSLERWEDLRFGQPYLCAEALANISRQVGTKIEKKMEV